MRGSRWEGAVLRVPPGQDWGVSLVVLQLDDHQLPFPPTRRTQKDEGWWQSEKIRLCLQLESIRPSHPHSDGWPGEGRMWTLHVM